MSSFNCSGEERAFHAGEDGPFVCHNCEKHVRDGELNQVAHALLCDDCLAEYEMELAARDDEALSQSADMIAEEYTEGRTYRVLKPNPRE